MISNHTDSTAKSTGAAAAVRAVSPCYLAAPPLPDVLTEQLEFLLGHAGHNAAGCAECLRLAQVVRLLMRPFE
jgi:hypothetical protein